MGTSAVRRWVVIPGLAETAEEFDGVLDLLPESYDAQVIDPWHLPVTTRVDALRRATGVADGDEIGLVGHSIGGVAALRWALSRPGEVTRLVLVDTSLPSETGHALFYPGHMGDRFVRRVLRKSGRIGLPAVTGPFLRGWLLRRSTVSDRDPLHRATVKERYGDAGSWLGFWDELAASWPMAAEVARLLDSGATVPSTIQLVSTGTLAGRRRETVQRALAGRLGAEVVILADAAHLVQIDRPDAIAAAMTAEQERSIA